MGNDIGPWEYVDLAQFLLWHSPSLRYVVGIWKQIPPLHILNEELESGGKDQGMSGGCFWKPFTLSQADYSELFEELITNPEFDLQYDDSLGNKKDINAWASAVMNKYGKRRE